GPIVRGSAENQENPRLAESRPIPQPGSMPIGSSLKPVVRWKTVTAGIFVVLAGLGSYLWFAKMDRETPVPQAEAPKSPAVSAPSLVGLGVSAERKEIEANEMINVTLKGQYSDGTQEPIDEGVQWLSSEPAVATIDDRGQVTARQAGETKITARYGDLVSPAWTLAVRREKPAVTATAPTEKPAEKTPVTPQLETLTVSAPRREVKTQERLPLRAKARYADGNEKRISRGVEWRTSDASIASVDSRGELVALRPGKIAVVARWGGIESVGLDIVVRESPPKVVRESPPKPPPEPPRYKPVIEPPSAPVKPVVELPPAPPAKPPAEAINLGAYINRAKAYRVQGNYAAALTELEKGRALNPSSQEVIDEIEATRRACNAEKRLGREDLNC
ncbi:MAG TPA: Ig-like domain-containing protein, partial [Candidatus Binatia bacterium]|nr:Ig-like domain-containing protein [Candidatus Binatia bacterium]